MEENIKVKLIKQLKYMFIIIDNRLFIISAFQTNKNDSVVAYEFINEKDISKMVNEYEKRISKSILHELDSQFLSIEKCFKKNYARKSKEKLIKYIRDNIKVIVISFSGTRIGEK